MSMNLTRYTSDTRVDVYPFTRQPDGEEIVIGCSDTVVFLALPPDAVEILDYLASGNTVGQTQLLYQLKYGEIPDLDDFLVLLEQKGFVRPYNASDSSSDLHSNRDTTANVPQQSPVRFHFAQFPQPLAQRLCSRPLLVAGSLIIGLALMVCIAEPSVIPGWDALLFKQNLTLITLGLTFLSYTTIFFHEMAHLIAARSVGVSSRLGLGHRLWVLVAETDMTGVWAIPKHQRYLPFLAGPLLDALAASLIILVTFATRRGWMSVSIGVLRVAEAMLLFYLLRLLWQCYFFVRTDFYYVIANFFSCKNLMQDTQVFIRNQLSRLVGSSRSVDQTHIPATEMRVIRWYALVWIIGRIAAFSTLIFITVPLIYNYLLIIRAAFDRGFAADPYGFIDALVISTLFFVPLGVGFWLWIRSLRQQKGKQHGIAI